MRGEHGMAAEYFDLLESGNAMPNGALHCHLVIDGQLRCPLCTQANAEWAIISSSPETSPPNSSDGDRILPTFVSRYFVVDDHLVVDCCVRTLPLHRSLRKGEDTHQIFHLSGWLLCALFVHVSVFFVLAMMTRQTMRAGNGWLECCERAMACLMAAGDGLSEGNGLNDPSGRWLVR